MITIKEVIKKSKVYMIKIDQEVFEIEPEVMLKYRIKPMSTYDEKTYQELINDQKFYFYRKKGLKKLSRMMTSYEMKNYLISSDCEAVITKQIIKDFETKGYLNDVFYVKSFIDIKKFTDGPKVITHKLLEKGISRSMIEESIKKIDEKEILREIIPHKVKSQKKESKRQMMLKIKTYFVRKGFSLDLVDDIIQHEVDWSHVKDQDIILKEFMKIYKQYSKKLQGYELKKKIYEKLYLKGYQKSDIEHVLIELDTLQIN
ncbi:MAG: RecX family transcriptional regulator [Acholeplasmataceae bacterium]